MVWITALILVVIAAVHLLWAVGYWFPIRDERALARAVVGAPGIERMPGAVATSFVVLALMIIVLALFWAPGWPRTIVLTGAALVMFARGIASYVPVFQRMSPEEPFATLDRRYYGPLCLALGVGVALSI